MAEYQSVRTAGVGARTAQIDEGLRAHMNKVYGLMSVAMVLTGAVAWAVGTNEMMLAAVFGSPVKWLVMFAPLIMVFAFSAMINKMSVADWQAVIDVNLTGVFLTVRECAERMINTGRRYLSK